MSLLDILFPKFCVQCRKFGSYLCGTCFARVSFVQGGFCTVCQKAAIGGVTHPSCQKALTIDGVFSSLVYAGVVKKLVYQFKYKPYLSHLKEVLTDFFYEGLIQNEYFYTQLQKKAIFVPIPLHSSRFKKRGYNQAHLLAIELAKKFSLPVADCLERIKQTETQVGLSQSKRQQNIKGAFTLKTPFRPTIKTVGTVFLIDDVVTSGATLREAATVLKKAGAVRVFGLTLAHGQ